MKKYLLDTNVLLRFLLGDHDELSPKAVRLFQQAANRECLVILTDLGIAEAVSDMRMLLDSASEF